jgi:hypothetical protein
MDYDAIRQHVYHVSINEMFPLIIYHLSSLDNFSPLPTKSTEEDFRFALCPPVRLSVRQSSK